MEQLEIDILDILEEIKAKEKVEEEKRKEIIRNGCPHTDKVEHAGLFSGERFLECKVCFKKFNMDGTEQEWTYT